MSNQRASRSVLWLRQMMPVMVSAFLILLSLTPTPLPYWADVMPCLAMISMYYWSVYRPDLLPPLTVFLLGLFSDALMGTALGIHSLAFLFIHRLAALQRRVFPARTFMVSWLAFAIIGGLAFVLMWMMSSFVQTSALPSSGIIGRYVTTLAFYPLIVWALIHVHRLLTRDMAQG